MLSQVIMVLVSLLLYVCLASYFPFLLSCPLFFFQSMAQQEHDALLPHLLKPLNASHKKKKRNKVGFLLRKKNNYQPDIKLHPDLKACTFKGEETILIHIHQPSTSISLNAHEIQVNDVTLSPSSSSSSSSSSSLVRPTAIEHVKEKERVVLTFAEELPSGDYALFLAFDGVLNDQMAGFYRSEYVVGEEKRNMAVTQFESTDARRAFPCWDEPALKATFKVFFVLCSFVFLYFYLFISSFSLLSFFPLNK